MSTRRVKNVDYDDWEDGGDWGEDGDWGGDWGGGEWNADWDSAPKPKAVAKPAAKKTPAAKSGGASGKKSDGTAATTNKTTPEKTAKKTTTTSSTSSPANKDKLKDETSVSAASSTPKSLNKLDKPRPQADDILGLGLDAPEGAEKPLEENEKLPEHLAYEDSFMGEAEFVSMDLKRPQVNVVVTGQVDAGKSTLMGHLLVKLGLVSGKELHKNEKEAKQIGKESFKYAWVGGGKCFLRGTSLVQQQLRRSSSSVSFFRPKLLVKSQL